MAVHPEAVSLAPMGPELTSRFFGVSNLLETLLLAPALLGAHLSPGPVMIAGLAAVLALEGGRVHRGLMLPLARRFVFTTPIPRPQQST